jgi:intracellular sulfur oxidation DsrE/DsrF family protein
MIYRVAFELTESASGKVKAVLGNIQHLREQLAPAKVEIELVAHSDGIMALYRAGNAEAKAIRELARQGVRFAACETTMASRGLTADDLLEEAELVPSGVAELVRRQAAGWLYLRP